jgi:DNA-binding transcriptional ArsR family regulator
MEIFALLAEPVRFRIIEILATGEHSAGLVADVVYTEFGVSRAAASKHLRLLARAGFAISRAEGPFRMYRLHPDALERLDRAVDLLHDLWDARYGWPYRSDPLAPGSPVGPRRPGRERGRRGRTSRPVIVEITEDNDPWRWMGD